MGDSPFFDEEESRNPSNFKTTPSILLTVVD